MVFYEKGATDISVFVNAIEDAAGTNPGEPKTGLLFSNIETGGTASYIKVGSASTDFTLITLASISAAHADGGFILASDTLYPGVYRLDLPDAVFSTIGMIVVQLVAAAANNCIFLPLQLQVGAPVDVSHMNTAELLGDGTISDKWRG